MLDPADIDVTALPFRLPGPATEGVMTTLEAVGTVLSERAAELGVRIVRGAEVSEVAQDGETVIARTGEQAYTARLLVGCDGGRSTVRKLAGFDFVGTEPQFTGYTMLAAIADPEKLRPGFTLTPTGMYLRMPTQGHVGMLDFDGGAFDRSRPPTRDHLQTVLRRVSGTDVTLDDVRLASSFTDRAMQATTYRRGRVLLAGDAAHIHSPSARRASTPASGTPSTWDGNSRPPCTAAHRTGFWTPTPASAVRSARRCSTGHAPRRPS